MKTKLGQGKKTVEEAVSYGVGHRIRIEILAALNERCCSASELVNLLELPIGTLMPHVHRLQEEGSIELAKTETRRNQIQVKYYRAVEMPFYSDEEIAAMSPADRQVLAGLILQASMAEALASLWAGKLNSDPRVMLAWNWFNVDKQGREEIADELAESWERVQQIEAKATARRLKSGEEAVSVIVTSLGYERSRTSLTPPDKREHSIG